MFDNLKRLHFFSAVLQFFIGRGLQNISEAITKKVNNCTNFDGFKHKGNIRIINKRKLRANLLLH
jgi:hypothetical protein